MKTLTKLSPLLLLPLLWLGGCSAPAPKPVITQPIDNQAEQQRLAEASQPFALSLKALSEKDYAKARDILTSLAQQYPEYAGIYANLGIAYMNLGEDEKAQQAFNAAIQKKPEMVSVYNQLALLHRQQGRFKEAESVYQQAIKVDPEYADAYLNLGILYDLYLMDKQSALNNYLKYQALAKPAPEAPVNMWIVDLTNRLKTVE